MSIFHSKFSVNFLLCAFQISLITASFRAHEFARKNNNDLHTCLSSSLPITVPTVYPCTTLTNQNSSHYLCNDFDVNGLSAIRGGRISHWPAVIVYANDSSHVQDVVKCATKLNYVVNALSGGHSYEGYSLGSTDNNVIVNMEAINYIRINSQDGTGTFGAGARLGPIYYTTYQYNYTVNGGSCAWVGLAGQALGGGMGFLFRSHGLLSDNVLEMKAVNAQGK